MNDPTASGYLLDTHEWLWLLRGEPSRLNPATVEEFLQWQRQRVLFVAEASVWEIALSVSKARLNLGSSVEEWVGQSTGEGGIQLLPLTMNILIESTRLHNYPHRDPGDRFIMATARAHGLTLVTRDRKILEYEAHGYLSVMER